MKHGVNLVALGSGVGMGFLGNSHYGLEDISIIRSIPGINISSPSDCGELNKILYDYALNEVLIYRSTGIPGSKTVYSKNYKYNFGKYTSCQREKVLAISTGSVTSEALRAIKKLNMERKY